jgi:hypothetical protein
MIQAVAGISGGRTSARMAFILDPHVVLCFQNTGHEHEKTYVFIDKLEQNLGREIVRLEWRAPPRGERPANATLERVQTSTLSRKGEPFRDLLECLAAFRKKEKGLGPIAPWARQRVCTAYLKIRTQAMYCRSLGWDDWTDFVGLRYDEPDRVALMKTRNDQRDTDQRAPLYDRLVTKVDVMRFWSRKSYDLDLPEHLGNCVACFLKDERDLADALTDPSVDADQWIAYEEEFAPMRRGGRPTYRQVREEAPGRRLIREAIARGTDPMLIETDLPTRRHLLIAKQESRPRESFTCSCEGAERLDDVDLLKEATG